MRRRQHLPRYWLMTDERQGEALWTALARLPRGGGVVFRHYALPAAERRALFARVRRIARRRRLVLIVAGAPVGRAAGTHGGRRRYGLHTQPAHDARELAGAATADLAFVSPLHPTRSHPGALALGRVRFGLLLRRARVPVIALGGMDARRGAAAMRMGAWGWAAIDAWSGADAAAIGSG